MRTLQKGNFRDVVSAVQRLADTNRDYMVHEMYNVPDVSRFATAGLYSAGAKLGFPAKFVNGLLGEHASLAKDILLAKSYDYFKDARRRKNGLLVREFDDKVYALLTDKYSVFDDSQVVNLLGTSDYLMGAEEVWFDETPELFHLRFISPNKVTIGEDKSPLSMAVFVNNSMIGTGSFKVSFGIYRWACTNGCISGLKEFEIIRERHYGADKRWEEVLAESLSDVGKYEDMLFSMVERMSKTASSVSNLSVEEAIDYLKRKLGVGKKPAEDVLRMYGEYGGETRWHLVNAITDVAHEYDLSTRLRFEGLALKVS